MEKLTSIAQAAVARVRVSNALNSSLWLCGITLPSGLIGIQFLSGAAQTAVLVLIFIPVIVFSIAFIYFMLTDPSKLRSEDYEIRKQALELIQEKGSKNPILGATVEAIANPDYRRLPARIAKEEES